MDHVEQYVRYVDKKARGELEAVLKGRPWMEDQPMSHSIYIKCTESDKAMFHALGGSVGLRNIIRDEYEKRLKQQIEATQAHAGHG